jgi:hypothetical protein
MMLFDGDKTFGLSAIETETKRLALGQLFDSDKFLSRLEIETKLHPRTTK